MDPDEEVRHYKTMVAAFTTVTTGLLDSIEHLLAAVESGEKPPPDRIGRAREQVVAAREINDAVRAEADSMS